MHHSDLSVTDIFICFSPLQIAHLHGQIIFLSHSGSALHCTNNFILKLDPNEELGFQAAEVILKSLQKNQTENNQ